MRSTAAVPLQLRWILILGITCLALLGVTQQVYAFGGILSTFNSTYPGSSTGANAGCQTCHGSSTSTWNEYGWGLRQNGQNFSALEGLPSININGGTTMLDEINASTQPGWTTAVIEVVIGTRGPAGLGAGVDLVQHGGATVDVDRQETLQGREILAILAQTPAVFVPGAGT